MRKYWIFGALIAISIILSCTAICLNISDITITDTSLVLGFIGVLATFTVVSNAFQLSKMEGKLERYDEVLERNECIMKNVANATQRNIFTFMRLAMSKRPQQLNEALLYALDIFQILPYLYGNSANECTDDGYNIKSLTDLLGNILKKVDNKHKIENEIFIRYKSEIQNLPIAYRKKMNSIEHIIDNLMSNRDEKK